MTQPTTRRKIVAFYGLTIVLSIFLGLALLELVLRNLDYTNSVDLGSKAQQRWYERHWKPFNELNLRDFPLRDRLNTPQPKIYFLGDSFTAGVGVDFQDTFFYKAGWQRLDGYNAFDISRPGASTRDELQLLESFNKVTGARARIVVQQYYVNDIEDYIALPKWTPPAWLKFSADHLESAQFLMAYRFNQEWLPQYKNALRAAHASPNLMEAHLRDLGQLHQAIRQQGGIVIFLVFPALSPDALMQETGGIVRRLRTFFAETCQPGDRFIDVTATASQLPESRRIVSFLDPHPSAELHTLVADQIRRAIHYGSAGTAGAPLYERCEDMKPHSAAPTAVAKPD